MLGKVLLLRSGRLIFILLLPAVIFITVLCFFYAPYFLTCRDKPVKSEVVVLFCSGDNKTRAMEAEKLMRERYAQYLIVPALGEMYQILADGKLNRITRDTRVVSPLSNVRKRPIYNKHYENTHIEALEAKRMMDEWGLRSALLVSSPYHMRRIRLIAGKIFDDRKYTIQCIPTSFERPFSWASWLDNYSRGILINEYMKLGWFMMYRMIS